VVRRAQRYRHALAAEREGLMGVRQATRWLVLGIAIVGAGCARRAKVEVEPPVTRTWVGNEPPPEATPVAPARPGASPGAATAPTPDAAVVAPAIDPGTPPAETTPATPPAKRGGWVKGGSWNR
jgi:hypothetical protein